MTTTLNIASLRRVQAKIDERIEKINAEVFDAAEFNAFKRYVGLREGLYLARHFCEEVETELNS